MKTVSYTFTAGQRIEVNLVGNYFRLVSTVAGVDIDFMQNGAVFATAQNMEGGFYTRPAGGFTSIAMASATAQTIKVAVGIGDGGYDRITGEVSVPVAATFTHSTVAKTTATDTSIAANATRRYLLIKNLHATITLRVNLGGGAISGLPTENKYIEILPGAERVYENSAVPKTAVTLCFATAPADPFPFGNVLIVQAS